MGSLAQRVVQFGRESTYGTSVAAAAILSGVEDFSFVPGIVMKPLTYMDGTQNSNQKMIKVAEMPSCTIDGIFSPEDAIYWLDSGLNLGVISAAAPTLHSYAAPVTTTAQSVRGRTLEFYDGQQEYEMSSGYVSQFSISGGEADVWRFNTEWFGQQVTASTLTGALSARSFTVLPTASTTITADDMGGTIGTTTLSATVIDWELSVNTGLHGKMFQSGTLLRGARGIDRLSGTLKLKLEANATGVIEVGKFLAGTARLIRIKSAAVALAYGQIDFCGAYVAGSTMWGNRDGNTTISLTLSNTMDTGAFANWLKIVNASAVTALVTNA